MCIESRLKILFAALVAWCAILPTQAQQTYTLKNCIDYTLQHHPNSTIYKNNAAVANEKIREMQGAFLPTVTANVNMDYNLKLQTTVIQGNKIHMGNKFSNGAAIQADQSIFDKNAALNIKAARLEKEIADLDILKQNETLIYNTLTAYYEALTYSEKMKLLQESKTRYATLVDILKLRWEQGVVRKSEYDRARVNLNNAQTELDINNSRYTLALNKLKNAMGLSLESALAIQDSVDFRQVDELALQLDSAASTDNTVEHRLDLKRLQQKALDIEKKKAAFLPTLTAYARYGANAFGAEVSPAFSQWYDYSAVGIKLNAPLFSGFKKQSQLDQSILSRATQELTNEVNNENYKLTIANATTQYRNAYATLKKNQENLNLAEDMMETSLTEYRQGATTLASLLDAEYSFKESRTNYIASLLDYLTAQANYQKSIGRLTTFINNLK